jgi:hypothetical protein
MRFSEGKFPTIFLMVYHYKGLLLVTSIVSLEIKKDNPEKPVTQGTRDVEK